MAHPLLLSLELNLLDFLNEIFVHSYKAGSVTEVETYVPLHVEVSHLLY